MLDKPSNSINKWLWIESLMTQIKQRRGISPLLATVILLGVTVAGGASVYGYYTSTQNVLSAAATSDGISVTNINAVTTDTHGTLDFTITNIGDKSWTSIAVLAQKGEVPKRIFYAPVNLMFSSSSSFSPNLPVTASAITDSLPGDGNGGLIGYSNLISYHTSAPFQVFKSNAEFVQPPALCTTNTQDISASAAATSICNTSSGFVPNVFHGVKLNEPLEPGKSVSPQAFLFTKVPTGVNQTATNQIDTVKSGDKLTLHITVSTTDGKQIVKTFPVTVR